MNASYTILPVPALMQIKESAFGRWTGNRFCGITPGSQSEIASPGLRNRCGKSNLWACRQYK